MVRLPDLSLGEDNMNKYLMLSAAAALVGTAGTAADAGSLIKSFQFGTSSGGSYCDGGRVYNGSGTGLRAWVHTNNNCGGGTSIGQGMVAGLPTGNKGSDMSDNFYAKNYGLYSVVLNYQLPKRIKNGHPWTLTVGFSGTSSFLGNSGVLINVGHAAVKHQGGKSTAKSVQQLIQVHKNSAKG
jgi:hypothetical protein